MKHRLPSSLIANNIFFKKDQRIILQNIQFQLDQGEFVGLIGPNGAGKSSLLKILAGLETNFSGQLNLVSDQAVPLSNMHRLDRAKTIAFLPQQEIPAWPLSVEHLVSLGRLPWTNRFSSPSSQDKDAIEQAIQQTDLQPLRHRNVMELSGGEMQRVLLARIFAGLQPIILVDEPISALDVYHQLHLMELLSTKATQNGMVCAALHDLNLAARFCHRLVLLDQGTVIASGKPVDVLTHENLRRVYGIDAHLYCEKDKVVVLPQQRVR